jgi:hypothetical protein
MDGDNNDRLNVVFTIHSSAVDLVRIYSEIAVVLAL